MTRCAIALFAFASGLAAQNAPNLSGYWELTFDSRSVPPAELTAAAASADRSAQAQHDADAIRWCHYFGVPYVMEQSPIDIVQNLNGKEIAIVFPVRSPGRHIYTDERPHVNPDIFDPVSNGHSIGHWEGDTLVVDTVGFSEEGVLAIPGGGRRTATSHLVERYRLLNNGERLSVTFTWEDPRVYAKAHSYEFRYHRMPKGTEAREFDCDASDGERTGPDWYVRQIAWNWKTDKEIGYETSKVVRVVRGINRATLVGPSLVRDVRSHQERHL